MTTYPVVELAGVVEIQRDTIDPPSIKSGTLYVGLENVTNDGDFDNVSKTEVGTIASTKFRFSAKHVLYGKLRPYLSKIARPNFAGVCSTDILPLMPSSHVSRDYLYHYLRQPSMVALASARATGVNLPRLSPKTLAEFPVHLPPLEEQKRIAAILDEADAIRRKRQQAIELTEQLLRSVFLDMFGDPNQNPMGWETKTIEELAKKQRNSLAIGPFGSNLKVSDYKTTGHPIVFVRDIRKGIFDWISNIFVADAKFNSLASHQVCANDVVITKMGSPPGVAAVYPATMPPGLITADVIKVTVDEAHCIPDFMAASINNSYFQRQIDRITKGVTRPKITLRDFRQLKIRMPPMKPQEAWYQRVLKCKALQYRYDELRAAKELLFKSLVQRAFRGELSAKEAA